VRSVLRSTSTRVLLTGLVLVVAAAPLFANATINIININAPGVGFNDPTPKAPIGGNPGTTLGQQRMIAFQYAAAIWAAMLDSAVPINIEARMIPGRDEVHQGPANDLVARVAEHSAAGVVHFGHVSVGIRDEDAIGGLLNQIAQAFLTLDKCAFRRGPRRVHPIERVPN